MFLYYLYKAAYFMLTQYKKASHLLSFSALITCLNLKKNNTAMQCQLLHAPTCKWEMLNSQGLMVDILIYIYSLNSCHSCYYVHIPDVPLATEPGISLIILPLMRILQWLQTHSSSFLTQRTYSCSNFVAISSLVIELLKKCRVR